jgi:hypothetical protein
MKHLMSKEVVPWPLANEIEGVSEGFLQWRRTAGVEAVRRRTYPTIPVTARQAYAPQVVIVGRKLGVDTAFRIDYEMGLHMEGSSEVDILSCAWIECYLVNWYNKVVM